MAPWHSECSSDPPAMAEWALQGRGTWPGGQHCLLKPEPGRTPCHDPWPDSSGTTHPPLPQRTDWQHHPLSPTEGSATCTHSTDGASREMAPGHPMRGLRDPQGQAEPAPSHCQPRACLPCHGAPHGFPPCVQARLAFGEAPFGGTLVPEVPIREVPVSEQHPQALGGHASLLQWWVFKQHRSSYANKAFWDFRRCVLGICLCQEHCSQLPLTAWGGDKGTMPCGDRSPDPSLYPYRYHYCPRVIFLPQLMTVTFNSHVGDSRRAGQEPPASPQPQTSSLSVPTQLCGVLPTVTPALFTHPGLPRGQDPR